MKVKKNRLFMADDFTCVNGERERNTYTHRKKEREILNLELYLSLYLSYIFAIINNITHISILPP